MPTNQTLEFSAGTGLTLSCKLFALGSDTVVATASASEKANDKNRYAVVFADIPAGAYRLNAYVGATGGFANEIYDLTLTQTTFYPRSEASLVVTPPTGARSVAITVRDTSNVAIQGATVRLERAGYSYTLTTNASGLVTFSVDDATYTVTITAGGFSFTPVSLVVGGNVTQTYQMTASTVSPSAPPYTTGFWTVLDLNGVAQANAQVTIQAANPPKDSTGLVLEDAPRTATANGSGVVQFTNLVKGATYVVYRTGSTRKFNVTVPANAGNTAALGSIVG